MARKKSREDWKTYGNVFDQFTLRTLHYLENQGYYEGITHSLKVGKEANIFLGKHPEGYVIVKIYRLENCNFNKMQQYLVTDPRFPNIRPQKRDMVFSWVLREYRNLLVARDAGCRVPTPLHYKNSVLLEEFIGDDLDPALQLKDVVFEDYEELEACFQEMLYQMKLLYHKAKLVHADLSEFNILYYQKKPVLIDFSQSTSVDDPHADEYLRRDIKNIVRFFIKRGLDLQEEEVYTTIIKKEKN